MAADEQAGEHAIDDLFMADDGLGNFGLDGAGNRDGNHRTAPEAAGSTPDMG